MRNLSKVALGLIVVSLLSVAPVSAATAAAGPVSRDCQSANPGNNSFNQAMQCRLQEGPAQKFGYTGPIDEAMGANSWKGVQRFLNAYYGYTGPIDGAPGTNTYKALQRWAADAAHGGTYTGAIDGAMGPNSWLGVDRTNQYDFYSPGVRR